MRQHKLVEMIKKIGRQHGLNEAGDSYTTPEHEQAARETGTPLRREYESPRAVQLAKDAERQAGSDRALAELPPGSSVPTVTPKIINAVPSEPARPTPGENNIKNTPSVTGSTSGQSPAQQKVQPRVPDTLVSRATDAMKRQVKVPSNQGSPADLGAAPGTGMKAPGIRPTAPTATSPPAPKAPSAPAPTAKATPTPRRSTSSRSGSSSGSGEQPEWAKKAFGRGEYSRGG